MKDIAKEYSSLSEIEEYLVANLEAIRLDPQKYGHPPHDGQIEVLTYAGRRLIMVSANRYGKTEFGMRDSLWRARGEHPYKKVKLAKQIWIGCPDYPSYERFTKPAFDQWCPPSWIIGTFNEGKKFVDIRRIDGGVCRIFFLSYDMPRTKWQGAGVDHIWMDEEMPEDLVNECKARIVTTRGSITLTFTPVEGVGWWYDAIFLPAKLGQNNWKAFQAALATRDPENEAEFEVGESLVPHLTREQIVEFASEYPDKDERDVRIFGEVRARTGLVYKGFRGAPLHLIPSFRIPPEYELWGAIDPGYHGFAVTIGAISPEDRVYICKELFSQQETTSVRFTAIADAVRELRNQDEWGMRDAVVVFFVDTEDQQVVLELNIQASAASERDALDHEHDSVTIVFVSLDQGLKARKAGFLRVQQMLHPDINRATPMIPVRNEDAPGLKPEWTEIRPRDEEVGEPSLYFFDDLYAEWQGEDQYHRESRILWEMQRYSWKKPPKGKSTKPDDGDENTAGGAHAMATLRYLIMSRLGPPSDEDETSVLEAGRGSTRHDRRSDAQYDFEETERAQLDALGY